LCLYKDAEQTTSFEKVVGGCRVSRTIADAGRCLCFIAFTVSWCYCVKLTYNIFTLESAVTCVCRQCRCEPDDDLLIVETCLKVTPVASFSDTVIHSCGRCWELLCNK
jgi:hypothetical protein